MKISASKSTLVRVLVYKQCHVWCCWCLFSVWGLGFPCTKDLPLSNLSPSSATPLQAASSHAQLVICSHDPLLPLPRPSLPTPHRHLSLEYKQVALKRQLSSNLCASPSSCPRWTPIAFLPQIPSSLQPLEITHNSQPARNPCRALRERVKDMLTTPTFLPFLLTWWTNGQPLNSGTKPWKIWDSRTGERCPVYQAEEMNIQGVLEWIDRVKQICTT